MARLDVYPSPDGNGYLLDVQAGLLSGLTTRMVVPLMPETAAPSPATRLNPVLLVAGEAHVMVTQFMASVPTSILKNRVTNLDDQFAAIGNALDMLFHGF